MTESLADIEHQLSELQAELEQTTSHVVRQVLQNEIAALQSQRDALFTTSHASGVFISGGTVSGTVTGVHTGTVNTYIGSGGASAQPRQVSLEPASFAYYEAGLAALLAQLGAQHARYDELLAYEQRLRENMHEAQQFGDTETRRAERASILARLNVLARETLGQSFTALSGL